MFFASMDNYPLRNSIGDLFIYLFLIMLELRIWPLGTSVPTLIASIAVCWLLNLTTMFVLLASTGAFNFNLFYSFSPLGQDRLYAHAQQIKSHPSRWSLLAFWFNLLTNKMARYEIRTAACLNVCDSVLMNKVLGSWSRMHCTCTVSRSLLAPRKQQNAKVEASIYGAQIQYVTSCWLHSYL